ncbi:MAG: metal-sensing transcriptional repressor [Chloroflexi bacterium]|nr:metal-sensing transcriptional repressor [Chloroflexota bacterium]MDA8236905.1 metal-sensing transcriptional repressor [Chloroflexota bacterium]
MTTAGRMRADRLLATHALRASGQLQAVARMIESGGSFAPISQQLLAVRGSVDSLLHRLIDLELDERLAESEGRADVDLLLRTAFGRSIRHGPPDHLAVVRNQTIAAPGAISRKDRGLP